MNVPSALEGKATELKLDAAQTKAAMQCVRIHAAKSQMEEFVEHLESVPEVEAVVEVLIASLVAKSDNAFSDPKLAHAYGEGIAKAIVAATIAFNDNAEVTKDGVTEQRDDGINTSAGEKVNQEVNAAQEAEITTTAATTDSNKGKDARKIKPEPRDEDDYIPIPTFQMEIPHHPSQSPAPASAQPYHPFYDSYRPAYAPPRAPQADRRGEGRPNRGRRYFNGNGGTSFGYSYN